MTRAARCTWKVALRKESVDRNDAAMARRGITCRSLSARRAWIEIRRAAQWVLPSRVALRKESVDRNPENPMISVDKIPSLSARRAWIEIFLLVSSP